MATLRRLKAQPRNLLAIAILLIIASCGFTSGGFQTTPAAHADDQRIISLYVDGQKRVITTTEPTVGALLSHNGVKLAPGDLVEPGAATVIPTGFFNINVYRARPIVVHDAGRTYQFASAYQSAHLLAQQAGLDLYPEDAYDMHVVTNFVAPAAQIGVDVTVRRATPLTVHVDGHSELVRTQSPTVGGAVAAAGIKLGLKDTLSVPTDAPVVAGMSLDVTRVADVDTVLSETLPFTTKTITDPTLLKGQTQVQTPGANGNKIASWRLHYENGVETNRTLLALISQTAPTTQVVVVGTKVLFAGSVEYWRPLVETAATQWGLDPNRMLRIMACESGGNALSISHFIVNGQHPEGLFQFLPSTWIAAGGSSDNILDGPTQIQLAAKKMATQGFSAWQCQ